MPNAARKPPTDKPDIAWAISEAERVLRENVALEAPIPILDIVRNYNLTVIEGDLNRSDAREFALAAVYDPSTKSILLPHDDPFPRKSFSLAHALGHVILHGGEFDHTIGSFGVLWRQPIASESADPRTQEAIAFAAHLLVPAKLLSKYNRYTVADLATLFAVPNDVIRFRTEAEDAA